MDARAALAIVAAVVAGLAGCGDFDVSDSRFLCSTRDPCPDGFGCRFGRCQPSCETNLDCGSTEPICEAATNSCIECEVDESCPDRKVCDPTGQCAECVDGSHCDSGVCDRASCVAATSIVYATPAGTGDCSRDAPCAVGEAIARLAAGAGWMHLGPGSYEAIELSGIDAGVDARDATVANLRVTGGDVRVFGGGFGGGTSPAIDCSGATLALADVRATGAEVGLYASDCELEVTRARIAGNRRTGVSVIGGSFAITSSFIVDNGADAAEAAGGVYLAAPGAFEFNTVAGNASVRPSLAGGVTCAGDVVAVGNLIAANTGDSVSGCISSYSNIEGGGPGLDNIDVPPMFVAEPGDYHLQPGAPSIDAAEPPLGSPLIDADGQPRPRGRAFDIGADEV